MKYKFRKKLNEDVTNNSFEEKVAQLQNGADPNDVCDYVESFHNGVARVELDSKWNIINADGKILSGRWFDEIQNVHGGFMVVKLGSKYNFIDRNGNILREDLWFDDAGYFDYNTGLGMVKLNGKWCQIDTKGDLYDMDGNPINNVNENKRRVVRITESQLRKTIEKVVTQCLNERKRR